MEMKFVLNVLVKLNQMETKYRTMTINDVKEFMSNSEKTVNE
jgi:hypothetical protein